MRAVVALLAITASALALAGCTQVRNGFACTDSASCRDGAQTGTCQPNGSCSFPDATCTSGQRYGQASDPSVAGVCVGDEMTGGDGGVMPPPATDTLMPFTTTDSLPVGSYSHASAVRGTTIYVSGGIVGTEMRDQVYVGTVNPNAIEPSLTLDGGWAATTSLPVPRRNHGMAISGDFLWVVAGKSAPAGMNAPNTADVLSAPIAQDGTVGAWTTHAPMQIPVRCAPAVGTATHLYLVGGKDSQSNAVDRVIFATTTNGTPGTWNLAGRLPVPLSCPAALVHNGYLLVVGGCTHAPNEQNACSTVSAAVYASRIQPDGSLGTFTNLTPMPAGRWHHTAAIGNGFLYVLGGDTTGVYSTTTEQVWAAPIQTDNTLGAWGVSRPLATTRTRPSAQVVGDYLFVIHQNTQVARLK